jgi:two-component system sensor histidine kinase ChvG
VVEGFRYRPEGDLRRIVLDIAEVAHNPSAFVVQGHEARLGRVITNLLDNALSFSPSPGVITISAYRVGPEIEIVVDDDGPGVPVDKLEEIFNRFYSDRPQTDATVGKNSGLGLSISREIVNAYGGRIWASNRKLPPGGAASGEEGHAALKDRRAPGVAGARFTVRLPGADAAAFKGAQPLGRRT